MVRAQNAIPVEYGERFHGCTPFWVPAASLAPLSHWRLLDANLIRSATCQPPLQEAISVPEALREQDSLEVPGRVGDAEVHAGFSDGHRQAKLSECWHPVYGTG